MSDFVPHLPSLHSEEWLRRYGTVLGEKFDCPLCATPASATITHTYGEWPVFSCPGCPPGTTIKNVIEVWPVREDDCDQSVPARPGVLVPNDPTHTPSVNVLCLGYDEIGFYYYQNSVTGHIKPIQAGQHREENFYGITPDYQYWFWAYGTPGDQKVDWKKAARAMMAECQLKGRFRIEDLRGGGIWMDRGRVVANMGSHLIVDGIRTRIQGFDSEYLYDAMIKAIKLPMPLTSAEARAMLPLFHRLPFSDGTGPIALSGMMVVGLLSGILSWRPHLWLTGAAESGKTSILTYILSKMWKSTGAAITDESTSAAGIRQKALKQSAVPVVMDEGESDDIKGAERVASIVKMARSASSDSDAVVYKGTQGGSGLEFKVRSCFVLCSIVENLKTQQDKQRFTVIQCEKTKKSTDGWPDLKYQLEDAFTPERGLALYASVIRDARIILRNIRVASRRVYDLMGQDSRRHSDQLGSFIAGYFYLYSMCEEITEAHVDELFHQMNYKEIRQEIKQERDTPVRCLHQIYAYKPQGQLQTLGEMAEYLAKSVGGGDVVEFYAENAQVARSALKRMGLDVEKVGDEPMLIVASNHPELHDYLEKKGFSNHSKLLKRIPGAKSHKTKSFGGVVSHSWAVPIKVEMPVVEEKGVIAMEDLPWEGVARPEPEPDMGEDW